MSRLSVAKTYKLFIAGAFSRTESGRSLKIDAPDGPVHLCRASRKDLRNAVEAARKAQPSWADANAFLRSQIFYRLAEMMEGKRDELIASIRCESEPPSRDEACREVEASIDRVVHYAGWCDKYPQVVGCANPVSGPYHNFTIPEPVGVVALVCPDARPLLGLVSLLAPAICTGNAVVTLASERNGVPACVLAEAAATSDLPAGVLNILTGLHEELLPHLAPHREVGAITALNPTPQYTRTLREGVAENLKRVTIFDADPMSPDAQGPEWISATVDHKTLWHPSAT